MDDRFASVYGLKDTRNGEIFYIGMSADPYFRYGQHLTFHDAQNAKEERILDMRKDGIMPELLIIEKDIPIRIASDREMYWIGHYIKAGVKLTNSRTGIKKEEEPLILDRSLHRLARTPLEWIDWCCARDILWTFKSRNVPECVTYFALKRFIRRRKDSKGNNFFYKEDILKYKEMLIAQGKIPARARNKTLIPEE